MIIKGLTFSYGDKPIFRSASVKLEPGINLILGPSGSGKTTLFKIFCGFLSPEKAEPSFANLRSRKSLLVLQEDALLPWLTGWENIQQFLKTKVDRNDIVSHEMFPMVESFLSQRAWEMSFGQRRMVELFRTLLFKPDLLCLDEPLNFIDPHNRERIIDMMFSQITAEYTLISSHDPNDFTSHLNTALTFDGKFPVTSLGTLSLEQFSGPKKTAAGLGYLHAIARKEAEL